MKPTPAQMAEAIIRVSAKIAGGHQQLPLAESHRDLLEALKNLINPEGCAQGCWCPTPEGPHTLACQNACEAVRKAEGL
jgi:hypothetical protein